MKKKTYKPRDIKYEPIQKPYNPDEPNSNQYIGFALLYMAVGMGILLILTLAMIGISFLIGD